MRKSAVFILSLLLLVPSAFADIIGDLDYVPSGQSVVIDDFEKGNYWIWSAFDWEQYGPPHVSVSARISKQWASQGKQSLECKMTKSSPDTSPEGIYYMDYHWDYSGGKYIVLDVYNPESVAITLCVALQLTDGWKWSASNRITVEPGMHTMVLDMQKYADDLYLVRRINICYYELVKPIEGHFYVDNMRLIK